MSQLSQKDQGIAPTMDAEKNQKPKTQKPQLKVVIPLPLEQFRKKPVLLTPPPKYLGPQKISESKPSVTDDTASEETVAQDALSQTIKESVPEGQQQQGLFPPAPKAQRSSEVVSPTENDTIDEGSPWVSYEAEIQAVRFGLISPRFRIGPPVAHLHSHPVFGDNVYAWAPAIAPLHSTSYTFGLILTPENTVEYLHNMAQSHGPPLDFSDCLFEIQLSTGTFFLSLHSTVVAKNKMLSDLIAQSKEKIKYKDQDKVKITRGSGLVGLSIGVIADAIRTLYGIPAEQILERAFETQIDATLGINSLTARMVLVTKFLIAGAFLEIDSVIDASLKAIREELNYENVEFLMVFALYGTELNSDHDPHDDRFYWGDLRGTFLELGNGFYGPITGHVLDACLDFLVTRFPKSFSFIKDAPISPGLGGVVLDGNDTLSDINPLRARPGTLQAIHFGTWNTSLRQNSRTSTILLSCPFPFLAKLHDLLVKKGRAFALEKVLAARNSRYLAKRQMTKAAQAEIAAKRLNGENVTMELHNGSIVIGRALWHEQSTVDTNGQEIAVRTYLGSNVAPSDH